MRSSDASSQLKICLLRIKGDLNQYNLCNDRLAVHVRYFYLASFTVDKSYILLIFTQKFIHIITEGLDQLKWRCIVVIKRICSNWAKWTKVPVNVGLQKKNLNFSLPLGQVQCISQTLFALGQSKFALSMIKLADNLPDPLTIGQVRKGTCPEGESTCPRWLDSTFFEPWNSKLVICFKIKHGYQTLDFKIPWILPYQNETQNARNTLPLTDVFSTHWSNTDTIFKKIAFITEEKGNVEIPATWKVLSSFQWYQNSGGV